MPPAAPGSISDEAYAAVIAYVMQVNGAPQADQPLTFSTQAFSVGQGDALAGTRAETAGSRRPRLGA